MGFLALTDSQAVILAAVVAAAVSAVIGVLTYRATISGYRAERFRLERELQRTMTAKLYDRRMDAYPKAWAITDGLRESQLLKHDAGNSSDYLPGILERLDEWASTDGAMILSQDSLEAVQELREALRAEPESEHGYSESQLDRVWEAKGTIRRELRRDVELLFREEDIIKPPSSGRDQQLSPPQRKQ